MGHFFLVAVLASVLLGDGAIGRSIDDLGHDDPAIRERAVVDLRSAGRAAWPELERAAEAHPDPEIRARAREIVAAAQLRRRLPWRVLDEAPAAVQTLRAGSSADRIAIVRVLARAYEETADLIAGLSEDPDPEVALAAAEVLQERRNSDWAPRILTLYASEDCPRASRCFELLSLASSRIGPDDLKERFADAGPRGRGRLMQLAMNANLPLSLAPEVLRGMLEGPDVSARRLALAWLRERGCPPALSSVEPLLSLHDPALVSEALATLRACGWRPPTAALVALLAHDEPSVREEAVQSVVAFRDAGGLPGLRRLLDDPAIQVRQAALAALPALGGASALEDVLALFLRDGGESRDSAAGILALSADWSLPRVKPLLRDPDPARRQRAYELWARIEGVGVLAPLATDADEGVRRWALGQLLRRVEAPGALEAVERFAGDPSDPVRLQALSALVRLEKREHAAALERFLENREYSFRFDAAETLLTLRDDRAPAIARKLLGENDGPLRRLGYFALADRSDRGSSEQALREIGAADPRLGGAAARYLRQLLSDRRDAVIVATLCADLDRLNADGLEHAFSLVMEYGDAACRDAVKRMLRSGRAPRPDRAVRAIAEWSGEEAIAELASLLGDDASVNDAVFARIRDARKRHPEAGRAELDAALIALFANPSRRIRRGALLATAELGRPLPELSRLVDDPEASVRCAAVVAARTLPLSEAAARIAGRLDDDDPDVRAASLTALLVLRPSSRRKLEAVAEREDCAWVRRKMDAALGR